MSQPGTAPVVRVRVFVAALAAGAFITVALGGCGGTATFVSATPPPDVSADAWFSSSVPAVKRAVASAMLRAGLTLFPGEGDVDTLIGSKQQVPYVGKGGGEPAPGRLPVYRVTATFTRQGDTHVRMSIDVLCPTCNGKFPYEWQDPSDLLRDVFDGARRTLNEKQTRVSYPPRYRPVRWRPPRRH